jgi:uncharacterized membrane protein YccF (DUF307 family)
LIFGGFFAALGYFIGGIALCITIIGIPFGLKAFRFAGAAFAPFGKEIEETQGGQGLLAWIFNIIWLILFGWEIALIHIGFGIVLAITIIGLPFAKQHFKLIVVALFPFSYRLN